MQLQVEDDQDFELLTTRVKESFKRSHVYQHGKLYYNEVEDIPENDYNGLAKYGVSVAELPTVNIETATPEESAFSAENFSQNTETRLVKIDEQLVKKAMARNPFFRFQNMKKYMPTLTSLEDFRQAPEWLGAIQEIQAIVSAGAVKNMNRATQLLVVEKYLTYIQRMLVMNYKRQRRTNRFLGVPVKEVIQDYQKRVPINHKGAGISELISAYDLKKNPGLSMMKRLWMA
ncbi:hypothetical protein [Fructobacillus cardui]|uniref:hypothetical protein n=1 Tax=Fructobacillus cardui TaxID=2893170 RepID=UPI00200A3E1A|nr:hypothetical protein [Fructobacillus cardui]MCK8627026.1 hypothetical protein [Fructobacillus cardui]